MEDGGRSLRSYPRLVSDDASASELLFKLVAKIIHIIVICFLFPPLTKSFES